MQEDIDHRAVALVINTTKMTGRAAEKRDHQVSGPLPAESKSPAHGPADGQGTGRTGAGRDEHRDHGRQHPLL